MTSFPVRTWRCVVGRLLVAALLLRSAPGCILLLDGWTPMSVGERATLADIVVVGLVQRTFKSARSADVAATYSAEIRITDVFKGRHLVERVAYESEVRSPTSGFTGNSSTSDAALPQLNSSTGDSGAKCSRRRSRTF